MKQEENVVLAIMDENKRIIEISEKVVANTDKYNKRLYTMYLSTLIAFTCIVIAFIICYFTASYDTGYINDYVPNVEVEQNVNSKNDYVSRQGEQ